MPFKNILFFFFVVFTSMFRGQVCVAQKIELKDVAKIECVINYGVMRSSFGTVEVVPENNVWNSYRTKFYQPHGKDMRPYSDSTRRFLRTIPVDKLMQLLAAIAKPDSTIKYDDFNISTEDLVARVDSAFAEGLRPNQQTVFIKALRSRSTVEKVVKKTFVPNSLFYNYQYYITITTKNNKTYRVNGLAFQERYHMPWLINNIKVYKPQIGEIFEFIMGDESFAVTEKVKVCHYIALHLLLQNFEARFAWEDLQTDFPEGYALLRNKKRPDFFMYTKLGWYGAFTSPRLPFYLHPYVKFKMGDTAAITRFNRFEDTLATAYKKGCFLFEYLKKFPKCDVQAMAGSEGKVTESEFNILKSVYPEIAKYSYREVQVLNVDGDSNVYSKWLLFPNNWVMIQPDSGKIASVDDDFKFAGLVPLNSSNRSNNDSGMFDNMGKRVDRVK